MTPPKRKLSDDYNYHDWSSYMVFEPNRAPKGPHFAAILFGTRAESSADYDDGHVTTHHVPEITYFAFPDREILTEWVLRVTKEKKNFFFFEVKQMGSASVQVSLDFKV